MKLYVFNPDTDMALANNEEHYMAPASIRRMAQDLALLPIWYAQPGSAVLAPSAYNADYLQMMKQIFPLSIQLITEPELPDYAESQIMPWGWNPAFRKRMLKGGIIERKLPTLDTLEAYRKKASRGLTIPLFALFEFNKVVSCTCGYHRMISGEGDHEFTDAAVKDLKNGYVFKSLWSGSGRGLRWCRHGLTKSVSNWCRRELNEHGAIMVEPIYDKVGDFAMEFYSSGNGKIFFTGYSRFTTDEKGAYQGNILVSDAEVEQWLQQYVPLQAIVRIRERLMKGLDTLCDSYSGPLGVDMMVCKDVEGLPYGIFPHVEINMRMTMGTLSHQLYDNFVASGSDGIFSVEHYPSNEALRMQHEQDMKDYSLVVENGRVVSGYLPLVPVTPQSRYRAYMRCRVRP